MHPLDLTYSRPALFTNGWIPGKMATKCSYASIEELSLKFLSCQHKRNAGDVSAIGKQTAVNISLAIFTVIPKQNKGFGRNSTIKQNQKKECSYCWTTFQTSLKISTISVIEQ